MSALGSLLKLEQVFGCHPIGDSLKSLIGHHLVSRNVFLYEKHAEEALKEGKFYLFTGRGPSSKSLQFGHLIPFMLCKHLQVKVQVSTNNSDIKR